jgi:hypothetical protein
MFGRQPLIEPVMAYAEPGNYTPRAQGLIQRSAIRGYSDNDVLNPLLSQLLSHLLLVRRDRHAIATIFPSVREDAFGLAILRLCDSDIDGHELNRYCIQQINSIPRVERQTFQPNKPRDLRPKLLTVGRRRPTQSPSFVGG